MPLGNITNTRLPPPQAERAYSEAQGGSSLPTLPGRAQPAPEARAAGPGRAGRGMPRPSPRSYRRSGQHAIGDDPYASGSAGQLRPLISLCIDCPPRIPHTDPFPPAGSFDSHGAIATPQSLPAPTMGARTPQTPASGRRSRPGPGSGAGVWSRGQRSSRIRFSGLGSGRVGSRPAIAIGEDPYGASCSAGRLRPEAQAPFVHCLPQALIPTTFCNICLTPNPLSLLVQGGRGGQQCWLLGL